MDKTLIATLLWCVAFLSCYVTWKAFRIYFLMEANCFFKGHDYQYYYERHGMYIDGDGGVVPDDRTVYKCDYCGKLK